MLAAFRLGAAFGHHPGRGEVLVDLPVQFLPVGDDHKGPVARHLAQHLLGEEHHRDALAAALGVPEHAQLALPLPDVGQGLQRVVDAQVLVVLGRQLDQPAGDFLKQAEVLHQVQQPRRVADAAQHGLQRHPARLVLAAHLLPLGEVLPAGGDAAHPALAAVGEDDQGVGPEKLRDGVLVVAQVAGEGGLQAAVGGLEFDEQQRQAVDKAHQVGAPGVHLARDPELRAEQKVVVGRVVPIHHPHHFHRLAVAFGIGHGDAHAVLEQVVDLAVGGRRTHARAVAGQFLDGLMDGLGRAPPD